ncbi:MAG: radical SAM protein [Planctomycetia bacterium]|nr:radical SAM protein [Candidatus Brocadia sp.]QOJ07089.1 MAG: radical SAM protein [Planctomycetia bacterium]TVL94643.1 MAG: radical SAM protein [Candidatus Brocadia sp. BL1]HQU32501.1 radical SAM protein [Candidatus Brocadia sapporoensis]
MFQPNYISLYRSGSLDERIEEARKLLHDCQICPRRCRVNRYENELGVCGIGKLPKISSYNPHFGEEPPLVGTHGSGTIFITSCNLGCVFCQNYEISHLRDGYEVSFERLAQMMIELQNRGCHNINFVTPTHVVPHILEALPIAIREGLHIPLVYNTGGYDLVETLQLLDGVFDIYMPDFKFSDSDVAAKWCKARDYPQVVMEVIREMHRQVGDLMVNDRGIAERGLIVRHLVMPNGLAGTRKVMQFLAQNISSHTYVNIMDQYHPCGLARKYPEINRRINEKEFEVALRIAREEGITRLAGQAI